MRSLDYSLEEARTFLAEGSPAAADLVLWTILGKNPREAEAWALLSRVAAAVNDGEMGARFASVARALGAAVEAPAVAPAAKPAGDRYLIIKAWGYGFCSDLDHTLAGLLLAEMSGRTPVTHWGSNSLFSTDPSGKQDAFRDFFEPVSVTRLEDVIGEVEDGEIWPPKWTRDTLHLERISKQEGPYSRLSGLQLLNRPEPVVVADYHLSTIALLPWIRRGHPCHGKDTEATLRYLCEKYLRPLPDTRDEVESFMAERVRSRPVIAAHIRGSDKYKEEPQLQQKQAMFPQAIDFYSQGVPDCPILLITDSRPIAEEYQKRYGARLILPPAVRSGDTTGVHHLADQDRRKLGKEVLRDLYLAAACDKFIGLGSSNVSATINHLKAWAPNTTLFLTPIITHRSNPYEYLSFEQLERYFGREWGVRMRKVLV
jgi:protein O-GlcNAc transferase